MRSRSKTFHLDVDRIFSKIDSTIAALSSKLPSSKVSVPVSRLGILLWPFDLLILN